jgi:hypothetical protein
MTFDELQIHAVNATGINRSRFRTNIFILTRLGLQPILIRLRLDKVLVIIELSNLPLWRWPVYASS